MRRSMVMTGVRLAAVGTTVALTLAWALPAQADEWSDERDRQRAAAAAAQSDVLSLKGQRSQVQGAASSLAGQVNESSAALSVAVTKLAASRGALAQAQAQLAVAQQEVQAAERKDAETAARLVQSQAQLAMARQQVAENQASLDNEQAKVGRLARQQYQQNTSLVGLATLVTPSTTVDVSNRFQWATTMFDTTSAQVTRLEDRQARLAEAKNTQSVVEARAAIDRRNAAANLSATQKARAQAQSAEAAVQKAVAANVAAEAAAQQALNSDKAALAAKETELQSVNQRIAKRFADQRAAESAASNAEQQRIKAEQARAAAAAAKRGGKAPAAAPAPSVAAPATSSGGLVRPVNAPLTSPYGMRLHPVLKVWKLHDGTDFGAGCGTPIRSAAAGVVTEAYYNGGYGNRLFVDHGNVGGRHIVTSYNHLSGYAVRPGQRVSAGQVIGYVGTTGYSTGCHLHLMAWVNGSMVNAMTLL